MDRLIRDIRYALRRMGRSPVFTLVAIASLALGIGANTAIFTLVNAVLLRDQPVAEPERLVEVYEDQVEFPWSPLSYPNLEDLVEGTAGVFEGVAASQYTFIPRDVGDEVTVLPAEMVNGDYFPVLGLTPALGRLLGPDDDVAEGAHPVTVLAYDYWQRAFGGDPAVVGTEIRLSGRSYAVVGVAPEAYTGNLRGLAPALYVPLAMINQLQPAQENLLEQRGNHAVFTKARLAPGVGMAEARTAVAGVASRLKEELPDSWQAEESFVLVPATEVVLFPPVDRVIIPAAALLMVVVALVLLIACANLASFLLARAADRRREVAVRLALGAGRSDLVRQLLTETILLAVIAGALGIGIAVGGLELLGRADLHLPIPIVLDLDPDATVLGFALAVSILSGILFGLAPALQSTNPDLATTLKNESTGGGRPRRLTLRNGLVVGQVAMSIVLLVGAGLFLRSFEARQNVDPGFGAEPAVVLSLGIPSDRYGSEEEGRLFLDELQRQVGALPGVGRVGVTANLHMNLLSTSSVTINVDGMEPPPDRPGFSVDYTVVTPGFFAAAGIPILRGRNFSESDDADAPGVAIINQALADRFFPDRDPVGQTIRRPNGDEHQVVGVARTTKVRTLGEAPRPFLYRPVGQQYQSFLMLVATTRGDATATVPAILAAIRSLDPDVPVYEAKTMERHLATQLVPGRLAALVLPMAAALALTLAALGLYGVVSYTVASRAREVGIRISLGADPRQVVRLLMRGGLRLVFVGGAIGVAAGLVLSQLLRSLLFGVATLDPVTFVGVPLLLAAVGFLAAWIPARRATRIDPSRALRSE